jgi:hypothetical protein
MYLTPDDVPEHICVGQDAVDSTCIPFDAWHKFEQKLLPEICQLGGAICSGCKGSSTLSYCSEEFPIQHFHWDKKCKGT